MRVLGALMALFAFPAFAGDWNPKAAAEYLDGRQKAWLAWPAANAQGAPSISCHTGLTYLLARPALARALGEAPQTSYERALLDSLRGRVAKRDVRELYPSAKEPHASEETAVESIFAALFIGSEAAFDRMWAHQLREGPNAGAWLWNQFDLDPWETRDAAFFGGSLAALAIAKAPEEYRSRPEIRANIEALKTYLKHHQAEQPMHNRLALLWASTRLPGILTLESQRETADELWKHQQPDGSWTLESLGRFQSHPNAPASSGSNAYATGFTTFVLREAGVRPTDVRMERALGWLAAHQNRETGYWDAVSMNKTYQPDSMMIQFMRDAATAYASLALAGPNDPVKH